MVDLKPYRKDSHEGVVVAKQGGDMVSEDSPEKAAKKRKNTNASVFLKH